MCTDRLKTHEDNHQEAIELTRAQAYWEEIGRLGAIGQLPVFDAEAWMLIMKTRFGWQDNPPYPARSD